MTPVNAAFHVPGSAPRCAA